MFINCKVDFINVPNKDVNSLLQNCQWVCYYFYFCYAQSLEDVLIDRGECGASHFYSKL